MFFVELSLKKTAMSVITPFQKKRELQFSRPAGIPQTPMQLALNQLAPAEKKCSSARVEPRMVTGTHSFHGWSIQPSPIGY